MQARPGTAEFSADLVPRFLKVDPRPHAPPAAAAIADTSANVNPRVAKLDQDEFNLMLLKSVGSATVAGCRARCMLVLTRQQQRRCQWRISRPASMRSSTARNSQQCGSAAAGAAHPPQLSDDELASRFEKLTGRPPAVTMADAPLDFEGGDAATDAAAAHMLQAGLPARDRMPTLRCRRPARAQNCLWCRPPVF